LQRKSADQVGNRVTSLGDFSPKNANLGTYRNREIFRGNLKINF
jgi:hypothetical protein